MKRLSPLLFYLLLIYACSYKSNDKLEQKNLYYDKAIAYRELGKIDSSYAYFIKAKDLYVLQKDSFGVGKCLVNMGYFAKNSDDYFAAQEISLSAIPYLDETKKDQAPYISSNYNTLGLSFYQLREYSDAIRFYNKALLFIDTPLHKFICLNNIAKVQEEIHNYDEAIKNYHLVLTGNINDTIEYSRALANLSFAKWLQNSRYEALPGLLKSLAIREQQNDSLGLNHSYAQLSDYHFKTDPHTALHYANKMYYVAKRLNRPDDKLETLDKLVKLNSETKSKSYFEKYRNLQDSIQTVRSKSKNQFALIRYETEKNKADFLKAQAENVAKQKNILIKNIGIAVLVVSLILGFFWYRRRQKLMKQEKEIEVKNTALTYSKKVHDRVANKVYHVMTEVEYSPIINKESILQKLDALYNISRDISHDTTDLEENKSFSRQVSELLISYQSEDREINIYGNNDEIWINITEEVRNEVFIILRELMTNMKKYSQSSEVTIQFQQLSQHFNIIYTDNGIGIQRNAQFGSGIKNTETRIKNIMGTITFETHENKGLEILIYFPIN